MAKERKVKGKAEVDAEAMKLVRRFLGLNQKLRQRRASSQEVGEWHDLKRKIENQLFSQPPIAKDMRRSIRIGGLRHPVNFEGDYEGQDALIKEVSEGGLFVSSSEPFPVGCEVPLHIQVTDSKRLPRLDIHLQARVVYNNAGDTLSERAFTGMGMALTEDVLPGDREKWLQWLDDLLEEASGAYLK